MARTGQMTYLRDSKKINTMARSIATSTTGCRTVSVAPPPNLRFSGCIRVSPCEAERSNEMDRNGRGEALAEGIPIAANQSRAKGVLYQGVACSRHSWG